MKQLFSAIILLLVYAASNAQSTFQIVYGDTSHNEARAVVRNTDGSYAFLGSTNTPGIHSLSDVILTKTDSLGANIWSVQFSSISNGDTLKNDYGFDFKQTPDLGYIICGSTYGSPLDPDSSDILLIKTDQFGFVQWSYTYGLFGNDEGYSVSLTHDNGYLVTGFTNSGIAGYNEGYTMKVDFSGTPLWSHADSLYQNSHFNFGCSTLDSGFVAAGCIIDTSGSKDLYVVKYDSIGNVLWSKRFGAAGDQDANTVAATADGGCILAGINSVDGSVDSTDMLIVKLDSSGTVQWAKTYNYLFEDRATNILQLSNGHYAVTGFSNATNTTTPVRQADFLELDATGDTVVTGMYGDLTHDNFSYSVFQTSENGFLLGGSTTGFGKPKGAAFIVKTDSTGGTLLCQNTASFTYSAFTLSDTSGYAIDTIVPNYTSFNMNQTTIIYPATAYCFSLTTAEKQSLSSINIYPNPVQHTLNIDLNNSGDSFETLMIHDTFGRKVVSKKIHTAESILQLNMETFKSGIYQLELKGQKNYVTRKFVKVD